MPVHTSVVEISIAVYKTACTLSAYTLALIATTLMIPAPAALFVLLLAAASPTGKGEQTHNMPKLKLPAIRTFSRRGRWIFQMNCHGRAQNMRSTKIVPT